MEITATRPFEGDTLARTATALPVNVATHRGSGDVFAWIRRSGERNVIVVSRAKLGDHPIWQSTFAASRKDHRYYEILEDTLKDRFNYKYFLITEERGDTLAVQPCFVMDQDMLEGAASLSGVMTSIRKVFPRFLMMRTLMVGCIAGEGHLPVSSRISAAEIGKTLAANTVRHAKALKASLVVMKEFPAKYREALNPLLNTGFAWVPSMPAVSLDVAHSSFDELMQKELRANARRHLKKNLAITKGAGITMRVTADPGKVLEDIHRLYLQVFEKSEFRAGCRTHGRQGALLHLAIYHQEKRVAPSG